VLGDDRRAGFQAAGRAETPELPVEQAPVAVQIVNVAVFDVELQQVVDGLRARSGSSLEHRPVRQGEQRDKCRPSSMFRQGESDEVHRVVPYYTELDEPLDRCCRPTMHVKITIITICQEHSLKSSRRSGARRHASPVLAWRRVNARRRRPASRAAITVIMGVGTECRHHP
jgi:hypothetical protein